MKISEIEVKGLWNEYDFHWRLNKQVNILSGVNGSGKSTILMAIASVLKVDFVKEKYDKRIERVNISFDEDKIKLCLAFVRGSISSLKKKAESDEIVAGLIHQIEEDPTVNIKNQVEAQGIQAYADGKMVKPEAVQSSYKSDYIATFDSLAPSIKNPSLMSDYLIHQKYTELDLRLLSVVEDFKTYQVEQSNRMAKLVSEGEQSLERIQAEIQARTDMYDVLDDLFSETGKTVDRDSGELKFIFGHDKSSYSYTVLSAGEKQLLLIILTVFMQNGKDAVLVMDEPEISMHVDWQRRLIDVILKLNPNCQLIIATHSPSMILNQWRELVVNISDLLTPVQA